LAHDPGARTGADVEDVHHLRVSVRRMRATLKAARPLLDAEWADGPARRAGWLGRSLGRCATWTCCCPGSRAGADLSPTEQEAAEQLLSTLAAEYGVRRTRCWPP